MRYDILDQARKQRDELLKDHRTVVSKAAVAVRASKAKYDAAQRRVMDLELAAVSAEVATNKERALQRR